MSESEDELVRSAISGDEQALSTLLEHHAPQVRQNLAGKQIKQQLKKILPLIYSPPAPLRSVISHLIK